jgi:hypothetical protein
VTVAAPIDVRNAIVRRRRLWSLLISGLIVVGLPVGFGHRGVHAVRSLLVPGAGLYNHRHALLGATFTLAAIAATVCWIRWGMDWLVGAVVVASMVAAAILAYQDHPVAVTPISAAHEFPLVILVMGALSSAQLAWRRSVFGRRYHARTSVAGRTELTGIEQCRIASISKLAGADVAVDLNAGALEKRCRRVGVAARFRFRGDPMRADHAHVRTALMLTGHLDESADQNFRADAARALGGVPSSEPGWTRLLDGTLAACALEQAGERNVWDRWSATLNGSLQLRNQQRPGSVWTPLDLRGPRADTWEHAAATAIAHAAGGLLHTNDWTALRKRTLAAAARGNSIVDDERLVAAGRIWLTMVEDEEARRVLGRVTIHLDSLAVALDAMATSLHSNPTLLQTRQPKR